MRQKHQDQGLIPAVGYIRMSTDDQKDSPERQRGEIVALAQRDGYQILRWYEDHGLTGTESKNRPGFQKLMADLPKREFKTVLMYEQSRFSREDVFDAMAHWKILKDAGVNLVTVQRGEMRFDDLAGLITAMVGQHEARSESIRLAQRSTSGKRLKATNGVHMGTTPFGFDREILDQTGEVVKRVSCWERFTRPTAWTSRLVPSADPEIVDAVRYIFQSVENGLPLFRIVSELNRRGIKTSHNKPFTMIAIRRILKNPVYIGLLRYGHEQTGQFSTTGEVILVPDAHTGIVSGSQFEKVASILRVAYNVPGDRGEPARYPLTRIIYCGHCGRGMYGKMCQKIYRSYICAHNRPGVDECDTYPSISAEPIESLVLRLVAKYVLCEENRQILSEAVQRMMNEAEEPSTEQTQLFAIRQKIEKGVENLALAEGANFNDISALLAKWREQEAKLAERVRVAGLRKKASTITPFSSSEELKRLRENLHLADKRKLTVALRQTVRRITVNRDPKTGKPEGLVEFFPEVFSGGPIAFAEADIWPDRPHFKYATYVQNTGRQVRSAELAEVFGVRQDSAVVHAKRAVDAGLLICERDGRGLVFRPIPSPNA
jgi:DNA invertase Pin-like site-specific DNA recombinase